MIIDKDFIVNTLVTNIDYIKCGNCRGYNCSVDDIKTCMKSHWGLSYECAEELADIIINGIEDERKWTC